MMQQPTQRLSSAGSDMAAQLVADIIHAKVDAQQQAEAAEVAAVTARKRRGRAWYFLFALPLLLGLTIWNLARASHPPEVFSAAERESAVRLRMYLASQAIEAYRQSYGRWPTSLADIGFGESGFVYEPGQRDYEIADTSAPVPLTYRRGDMVAPFADAYQELQRRSAP